jgi:hypothetical protein
MNPTTLFVPALVVVAAVIGRWLLRRNPEVSKRQIFHASAALLGGIMSASNPTGSEVWFYIGSTIASIMASFLLMALLRRWDIPRPSRSS